jgi:hypothetical protein
LRRADDHTTTHAHARTGKHRLNLPIQSTLHLPSYIRINHDYRRKIDVVRSGGRGSARGSVKGMSRFEGFRSSQIMLACDKGNGIIVRHRERERITK